LEPKKRHHAFFAIVGHVRGHATFQLARRSSRAERKWMRELARQELSYTRTEFYAGAVPRSQAELIDSA
jgi:hypothetical protein